MLPGPLDLPAIPVIHWQPGGSLESNIAVRIKILRWIVLWVVCRGQSKTANQKGLLQLPHTAWNSSAPRTILIPLNLPGTR